MKITTIASSSQDRNLLDVAFDVSKSSLECYAHLPGEAGVARQLEHRFANRPRQIQGELTKLHEFARQAGYEGLRVVCEPTAGYENRLLHAAREAGHRTAYVSGEAVNKAQVIGSNDTGKTDHKDPRTILMLGRMGKTLTHWHLTGDWKLLRALNVRYERLEGQMVELKNRIYPILDELFCELDFSKDWLFKSDAVVRGNLYAEYYHHKKSLGMIGPKAMTAVSRKFLKLLFGLQKSAKAYHPQRVFCCQSQYHGEEAA